MRIRRLAALPLLVLASPAIAQCQFDVEPGFEGIGTNSAVRDIVEWDPDGAGPEPTRMVIAGSFSKATRVPCEGVAIWNGTHFEPLGDGLRWDVHALQVDQSGTLLAAGDFILTGTTSAKRIARWNGSQWVELGGGLDDEVFDMELLPNGDIVAGGRFSNANGLPARRVARWDGTTWHPYGAGLNGTVYSMARLANGNLVVGGTVGLIGSPTWSNIAYWDGSSWNTFGSGANDVVNSMRVLGNGDLVIAGEFTSIDGVAANRCARWDGSSWHAFGAGAPGDVTALGELQGAPVISVNASFNDKPLLHWNGSSWQQITSNDGPIYTLRELANGSLMVGGAFNFINGIRYSCIARWDGTSWSNYGRGFDGPGVKIVQLPNSDYVVAGNFLTIGGESFSRLAQRHAGSWQPLGAGVDGHVTDMAVLPNGDLVVCGSFNYAGGILVDGLARWDGTNWHAFGSPSSNVADLHVLPNGDLLVGGSFLSIGGIAARGLARWNGTTWSAAGDSPGLFAVSKIVDLPNGDIVAAGAFLQSGLQRFVRWNGSTWLPMDFPWDDTAHALQAMPDGSLVVGSVYLDHQGVQDDFLVRWDGSGWHPIDDTADCNASDLLRLPDDDVLVFGQTNVPGFGYQSVARWDGSAWVPPDVTFDESASTATLLDDGRIVYGGTFGLVTDVASGESVAAYGFAVVTSSCTPDVDPFGNGCVGAGGTATLSTVDAPAIGSTFVSQGSSLPTTALVAEVTGFTPITFPLGTVLSPVAPGCELLVTPDIVTATVTGNGTTQTAIELPMDAALIGAHLYQQLVPFELDAALQIVEITASNGLDLTVGRF